MHTKIFSLAISILFIFLTSCSEPDDTEKALSYLKENRELRVGYDGNNNVTEEFKSVYQYIDSLSYDRRNLMVDSIVSLLLASNYNRSSNLLNDNDIITDSFLFEHSAWAIEQWNSPWCRHLNFDEFCKFLLPYRINKEPFEDWKQVLSSNFLWIDTLNKDSLSAFDAVCQINDSITKYFKHTPGLERIRPLKASEIIKLRMGHCHLETFFTTVIMRTAGLPVAYVFNKEGHAWNVFIDTCGTWRSFQGCHTNPTKDSLHPLGRGCKRTKIFMSVLHPSKNEIDLLKEGNDNFLPNNYLNFFCEDVTSHLIPTNNLTIPLTIKGSHFNKIPFFICSGQNRKRHWVALNHSFANLNNTLHVNEVGSEAMYIIGMYNNKIFSSASNPFYVFDNGSVRFFAPDSSFTNTITLTRKTDLYGRGHRMALYLNGTSIMGANNADFSDGKILHTINKIYEFFDGDSIKTNQSFRYFKVKAGDKQMHIAEFELSDVKGNAINGKLNFGSEFWNSPHLAFDNNPATFLSAPPNAFFTLDAGRPVQPGSFKILARNDLNLIENGEPYCLFMWKDGGWVQIAETIGANHRVVFTDLPANALFYLAHKTKGKESTPFWIENGQVRWTIQNDFLDL